MCVEYGFIEHVRRGVMKSYKFSHVGKSLHTLRGDSDFVLLVAEGSSCLAVPLLSVV